jgi:nucleoside-diphosphate-sugar epimerase
MRVFVAGGTGVIGRTLVPLLVARGHEVTAMTRSIDGGALLRSLGAQPVMADALDRDSVVEAVVRSRPDAIIHQLTDLRAGNGAANATLRIEGTRNLVDAAHAAGVERVIAQSLAWAYVPGDEPADEQVSLDVAAAEPRSTTVRGITALEAPVPPLARVGRAPWARGADNARAREQLGWTPRYVSWHDGFQIEN